MDDDDDDEQPLLLNGPVLKNGQDFEFFGHIMSSIDPQKIADQINNYQKQPSLYESVTHNHNDISDPSPSPIPHSYIDELSMHIADDLLSNDEFLNVMDSAKKKRRSSRESERELSSTPTKIRKTSSPQKGRISPIKSRSSSPIKSRSSSPIKCEDTTEWESFFGDNGTLSRQGSPIKGSESVFIGFTD